MNGESINNLPVVRSQEELNRQVRSIFTPDRYNVLVPEVVNFGQRIKMSIQILQLDDNLEENEYRNRDFWSMDRKTYNLTARAVNKIAHAANVTWIPAECRREKHYGKDGKLERAEVTMVCSVLSPLGNLQNGIGTYEWNVANDLSDPQFLKKVWDKRQRKYIKTGEIDLDRINQRRRFGVQLAETGAMVRAIYNALGFVYRSYPREAIGKPFVIPCVHYDIDMYDPYVNQAIISRAIGAQQDVYGRSRPLSVEAEVVRTEGAEAGMGMPSSAQPSTATAAPPAEPSPQAGPDKRAAFAGDWRAASPAERAAEIKRLAELVGQDLTHTQEGEPQPPPEQWNEQLQLAWLMWLATKAGIIPPENKGRG